MSKHLRFEVEGYLLTHLLVGLQFLQGLDLNKRKREEREEEQRRRQAAEKRLSATRNLRLSFPLMRTRSRDSP